MNTVCTQSPVDMVVGMVGIADIADIADIAGIVDTVGTAVVAVVGFGNYKYHHNIVVGRLPKLCPQV